MNKDVADHECYWCARLWNERNPNLSRKNASRDGSNIPKSMVLPHPECRRIHCGEDRSERSERMRGFYRASSGRPIKEMAWCPDRENDSVAYSCDAVMDFPHSLVSADPIFGSGTDVHARGAMVKACMEALERFGVYMPPRSGLHWGNESELRGAYSKQLSENSGRPGWWSEVHHLQTGQTRLLPLEQVQWPQLCYAGARNVEVDKTAKDSTGYAVHEDNTLAVTGGFNECIERAALAAMWREGAHALVRAESYPPQAALLASASSSSGYRSAALHYELKNCGVASLVLLKRDNAFPGPALVAGGGGGSCVSVALDHAMLEAYGMLQHAQSIWPRDDNPSFSQAYKGFLYYLEREPADQLWKYLGINSLPEVDCSACEDEDVSALFERLRSYQDDIFVVDRGNKLTDYLGLRAVQVIIPALEALDRESMRNVELPFPLA